jgi:hypothetical protein
VIKINVHPPGCRCSCGSKGAIPFMLNRPGDGLRPLRRFDLDGAMLQVRDWAVEATRSGTAPPRRSSDFELRTDMSTITLTVETADDAPVYRAKHWDTREEHASTELAPTLARIRAWCDEAVRR